MPIWLPMPTVHSLVHSLCLPQLLSVPAFPWGFASLLLFPGFSWAVTESTVEVERKEPPVCV